MRLLNPDGIRRGDAATFSNYPVGPRGVWRLLIGSGTQDVAGSVAKRGSQRASPSRGCSAGVRRARMPGRSDGDADLGTGAGQAADGEEEAHAAVRICFFIFCSPWNCFRLGCGSGRKSCGGNQSSASA